MNSISAAYHVLAVGLVACALACTDRASHSNALGVEADGATAFSTACLWPASLDPPDVVNVQKCVAARTFLSCNSPNGGGEECLSNDPTRCTFDPPVSGGSSSSGSSSAGSSNMAPDAAANTCQNFCEVNEYAVGCGPTFQGSPPPGPPSEYGCHEVKGGGGGPFYCCPCM